MRDSLKHPVFLLAAAIVLLPLAVRPAIASEIWIFAMFGLGLNLILGYTGLLSFGQSTFFGSAAYVAGWLLKHYGINVFFALGVGAGVGALSAAVVGYLCVQRSGLYFIMLTFALNQMFYFIAYQWTTVTGGEDGMPGVPRPALFGIVPLEAIGFVTSGNVVFATLIGGSGSLYGPVIGSFVFIWLSESVSTLWARWPLLLGMAFVIVVLFLRGGVVEAWTRFWTWRSSKQKA